MRILTTLLGLFILLNQTACLPTEPDFTGPKTWLVSQMEHVFQGEWQNLDARVTNKISSAKNEYEAFQLVIRAPQSGLSNVNVSFSNFQNGAGETLPSPQLFREHYVYVARAGRQGSPLNKNVPGGRGWYPDALIPFDAPGTLEIPSHPFSVEPRRNQPVWIDVFVPENASAGTYTSRYTVESEQGLVSGEITLEVWDFALPKTPSLHSSFLIWEETTAEMRKLMTDHKVMPRFTPQEEQASAIANNGLNATDLRFWGQANVDRCELPAPPSVEEMKRRLDSFQQNQLIYNYTADEIDLCTNLYSGVKAWARNLHEIGVKQLITMFPVNQLLDDGTGKSAVDIWVFTPKLYLRNSNAQGLLDKALEVSEAWSYTALMELDDTPKWGIDYLPMNHRIMHGFMNQMYGLTGVLYWRVDLWFDQPWRNVTGDIETWPSGEGMLTYPGQNIGLDEAVPSMRLKWIREGVEDFEYVQILSELGQAPQAKIAIQKAVKDWRNWTKDQAQIDTVRAELAELVIRYQ